MPPLLKGLVLPLLAALLIASMSAAQEPNPNARFGLPSPAKADPRQREDYLITRPQYVLSVQQYQFVMWFNRRFHDAVERQRQAFGREDLRRLQSLVRDHLEVVLRGLQADERAEAVNRLLLGVRQPLRALAEFLRPLRPAERGSVLEVHSLLKQEPAAERG